MSAEKISKYRTIGILLFVALLVSAGYLMYSGGSGRALIESSHSEATGSGRPVVFYGPPGSLAVLPFQTVDLPSEDAFLGIAVPAVLLRQLGSREAPQVTAGTSSFFFLNERPPTEIMGQRLQASRLLEGRFSGDGQNLTLEVRILRSRDGKEMRSAAWSEPRERLLALQQRLSEFAAEAVDADAERLPRPYVVAAPKAWESFLHGLFLQTRRAPENRLAAEAYFLDAIDAEPGFSEARLELAANRLAVPDGTGSSITLQAARDHLEQTLAEDGDNGRALAWLAWARHRYDDDWAGAEEAAHRALKRLPGDPWVLNIAGLALFTRGAFEEVEELLSKSVARDPLNLATRLRLGLTLEFRGDHEAALSVYRTVASLNADFPGVHAFRARVKLLQGKGDSALAESEQESDPFWGRYARILALFALERSAEAEDLLKQMIEQDGSHAAYQVAEIQAHRGEVDLAFQWLETAREQEDRGLAELVGNPFFEGLAGDPRWQELLAALGHPLD